MGSAGKRKGRRVRPRLKTLTLGSLAEADALARAEPRGSRPPADYRPPSAPPPEDDEDDIPVIEATAEPGVEAPAPLGGAALTEAERIAQEELDVELGEILGQPAAADTAAADTAAADTAAADTAAADTAAADTAAADTAAADTVAAEAGAADTAAAEAGAAEAGAAPSDAWAPLATPVPAADAAGRPPPPRQSPHEARRPAAAPRTAPPTGPANAPAATPADAPRAEATAGPASPLPPHRLSSTGSDPAAPTSALPGEPARPTAAAAQPPVVGAAPDAPAGAGPSGRRGGGWGTALLSLLIVVSLGGVVAWLLAPERVEAGLARAERRGRARLARVGVGAAPASIVGGSGAGVGQETAGAGSEGPPALGADGGAEEIVAAAAPDAGGSVADAAPTEGGAGDGGAGDGGPADGGSRDAGAADAGADASQRSAEDEAEPDQAEQDEDEEGTEGGGPGSGEGGERSRGEQIRHLIRTANYQRNRGELDSAHAHYLRVLRLDGRNARALAGLTRLEMTRGQPARAIRWARRLVQGHPRNPSNHVLLGDTYLALGNRASAVQAWGRALELSPGHRGATRRLAQ